MLLTISTTHHPATDLGFLLHKHPDRLQSFSLPFGNAHVFYPEASEARCTAALMLELDPVSLVRGRAGSGRTHGSDSGLLASYVNDRPYVASSFLSVGIARVLGSALGGRSNRPGLTDAEWPFEATILPVRVHGGIDLVNRLFEPLGYAVSVVQPPDGPVETGCYTVSIAATIRLQHMLSHLYVLIPVLDDEKHYWVAEDEIDKLLRHGDTWLPRHPERELIARRYLKHGRRLARLALERLAELDDASAPEPNDAGAIDAEHSIVEQPVALNERRIEAVLGVLKQCGATRVLDLGCGEGRLLRALLRDPSFTEIVGVDVSARTLEIARERVGLDRLSERQIARVTLLQSALTYRDRRLAGYDAAVLAEVIEHIDPPRLPSFARAVFGEARPATIVLTTPNRDYNAHYPTLGSGKLRHPDHRFEWTRAEFADWTRHVAESFHYTATLSGVGDADPALGPPTQMAVFRCA